MYSEVFPTRLKEARNRTGFTQQEVANELKINNVSISHYERGEREPDVETLARLADFYGVSSDWLIGRGSYPGFEPDYKWDGLKEHASHFVKNLKTARIQKGLSQAKVAKLTGIHQSNIAKYELGQLEPSIETLGKLSDFYRVSADRLLGLTQ